VTARKLDSLHVRCRQRKALCGGKFRYRNHDGLLVSAHPFFFLKAERTQHEQSRQSCIRDVAVLRLGLGIC